MIPYIFSNKYPLIIRPLKPTGFQIETHEGMVIFTTLINFDRAQLHLAPADTERIQVTVELEWIEE